MRITWKRISDWLPIVFHFGTEDRDEQLKKAPCILFYLLSIRWRKTKTAALTLTFFSGGEEKRRRKKKENNWRRRRKTEKEKEENIWRRSLQKLSRILRSLGFGLGLETFSNFWRVSVSVSEILFSEKKV